MFVPEDILNAAADATAVMVNGKKTHFPITSITPAPTLTPTPTSLPTVIPNLPVVHHQVSGDVGHRTLWVVCVIMGITSVAFYAMAWRVPVVSFSLTKEQLYDI
jgi:acid stress-induced BolA-like protein IbaG/YrbA